MGLSITNKLLLKTPLVELKRLRWRRVFASKTFNSQQVFFQQKTNKTVSLGCCFFPDSRFPLLEYSNIFVFSTLSLFLSLKTFHKFNRDCFMDVEGMKCVKWIITLLAITGQFIPPNRCRSEWLRKQMLNNYGWLTDVNSFFRMFSWLGIALR